MSIDPHLHLHAHVELDRSCNRCSRCCFPKKHRRIKTISEPELHVRREIPEDLESEKVEAYLRLKRIVCSRFSEIPFSENYIMDLVQMRSNVKINPHHTIDNEELNKIFQAIEDIAYIIRNDGINNIEVKIKGYHSDSVIHLKRR